MDARTVVAVLLLGVLGGGLWWVVEQAPAETGPGTFAVYVVAPDGSLFANGTVDLARPTALAALQALADLRGFHVGTQSASGFAGCSKDYVRSIGPFDETASGGWNYYTRTQGGTWEWRPEGAGCPLHSGLDVEWCWVERDVCGHHVA